MLNSFLKKEYHGAQAELALSMVLGWLWTPDPRASTFCTIIQAVLGTEPGLSALYQLSYIPCPKFYNVSSSVLFNTFKWAPKCTHLPLINKSKLSQVYNRSIQSGGLALPSLWAYQYFLSSSVPFCPHTEPRRCHSAVDFSFGVSTATAFHGFGFLPTLHLGFIENLTHETRLLPSSAVIIWFKRITGLKKAKFRFGLNHLVGKLGWYKAVFQEAVPCGRAAFNKY